VRVINVQLMDGIPKKMST